jgi:hypothetical protein
VVSLAFIMRSAGITDLCEKQGTEEALAGMLERLHPHLSDIAAAAVMRSVFADGASAFMPRVMDQMHRLASTFR